MEEPPRQEEMFPEIAKTAKEDIITSRRERHKKISDIEDMRKLGRYAGAVQKEKKELELKNIRKEIMEEK